MAEATVVIAGMLTVFLIAAYLIAVLWRWRP